MSYINKMQITGVRAFPISAGETIKFDPPLTIVAGVNGSGKTTIIECLRFATTGSLPPGAGTKGSWIHDPGLQGQNQVNAQVKLMFHAANGTRLVVVRNLLLQLKNNVRTQKTREASLLVDRHGQKMTLSTRVAELDQQVPLYLGVSTSLLDNVIFCHQEDSQWPLAESSVLKKKFDDIFEAGRYTRAVKELLDIRKKHRNDLGRQQALADAAKKDRDRARKVKAQCERLNEDVVQLSVKRTDLQQKMKETLEKANQAWKEAEAFAGDLAELQYSRSEADRLESALHELKQRLKEIPESDEWLRNTLADFDNSLSRYEENRRVKKEQWLEYEDELNGLKTQLDERLTEQGQYQHQKAEYQRQLERRKSQVKESAVQHQIRGFDDLSDDNRVEDFMFKIKKISKDRSNKLDQARLAADTQKREANTLINQLTEREKSLKDNKATASTLIADNNQQVAQRQAEADAISANEGNRAAIESRLEELQERLKSVRESSKQADYPTKIRQGNLELSSLEEAIDKLNHQLIQGTKRAGEVAQLSHVKQEVKDKERSLSTLLLAHKSRICDLIGSNWDSSTLEPKYKNVASEAAKETVSAERERDSVVREVEQNLYKQRTLREDLDNRKSQAQQHRNTVTEAIDGDISEYEEELKAAAYRVETARENAKEFGGLVSYFGKVLDVAENKHACRLCERPFKGPDDARLSSFKRRIQTLIERASFAEAEAEVQNAVEDHKVIADTSINYENWKRLSDDEIPTLEKELAKLEKDHNRLLSKTEALDKKVEERQLQQREIESISNNVGSIVKLEQELKSLNTKVEELTSRQSQHGDFKTLEDIQDELNATSGKAQEIKRLISRLTNEQDTSRSETYALELELRELKNELEILSRQLDRKSALLDRIQEYKDVNQKQREMIKKFDEEVARIGPELDAATAKRNDVDERANSQLRELEQEAQSLDKSVNALQLINAQIQAYVEEGGDNKLERVVREVERTRNNITQLEAARTQLTKEISKVEEQLRDSDNMRRHYADNLKYRQDSRKLKDHRGEIEALELKNVEHDRDQLMDEAREQQNENHRYAAEKEGVDAELKVKDVHLGEMRNEYMTDLKDAPLRYKEAHIKVESTKAAIEDIGKYSTALDQAVTKYHSLKMEQVNNIIDELWKATYMGTDVDTIYIKSDLEVKANTRSHNYRVVMLKRDVELDMRGRCSAGQKVLASIIIRLALAECFSRDCGVIALDEPTTNLDEKNVEALAESLHKIIESRRHQKNFQLIIITHDERFLELMNCAAFTDYYWRISRNEKDDSVIERQSILEVMRK